MNICSNCGRNVGPYTSIFTECVCQYTMTQKLFQNHAWKLKWVGLTDEEIHDAFQNSIRRSIYEEIEAKLKEKNT